MCNLIIVVSNDQGVSEMHKRNDSQRTSVGTLRHKCIHIAQLIVKTDDCSQLTYTSVREYSDMTVAVNRQFIDSGRKTILNYYSCYSTL